MPKAERQKVLSLPGQRAPRTRAEELWTSLLWELLSTKMTPKLGTHSVASGRNWVLSGGALFAITATLKFEVALETDPDRITLLDRGLVPDEREAP